LILKLKAQNAKYKSLRKNITAESKTINRKNDLEGYLLKRDSGFSPEYKFLKTLLDQLKTEKISNEEDLKNYIKDHFKKYDESQLLLKQSLYKDLEKILGTYLNDFEKNKKMTVIFDQKFDFTIPFDDVEQYHSLTQKIYGIAGFQAAQKLYEKSEKEALRKEKLVTKKSTLKPKKNNGELSKKQIKDRQVYGAIRAYAELMKVDGDMDPNEMMLLGKLTQEEQKKLSGSYNQESDEFKFVWAKGENVLECLKTYNKNERKSFFNNLFAMVAADGDIKDIELNFLVNFYTNITGFDQKKSLKDVKDMLHEFFKK